METIKDALKLGLANAYFTYHRFNKTAGILEKAIEYVFTVETAKSIMEWRDELKLDYNINIEYPEKDFFRNAFKKIVLKPKVAFPKGISEKGRIDIVITDNSRHSVEGERVLYGIELKGIKPDPKKINVDIKRLISAMNAKIPEQDNSIKACFSMFITNLATPSEFLYKNDVESKKEEYQSKLIEQLDDIIRKPIIYAIDLFIIQESTTEEYRNSTPEEQWDSNDAKGLSDAAIGVIITLQRNSKSN